MLKVIALLLTVIFAGVALWYVSKKEKEINDRRVSAVQKRLKSREEKLAEEPASAASPEESDDNSDEDDEAKK